MLTVKDIANKRYRRDDFVFFWGHENRNSDDMRCCLSQWYMAPMVIDGIYYNCMEQYLMAEKARTFDDEETLDNIMSEHNQMTIKKLGRQVRDYDDAIWSCDRQDFSVRGNLYKFAQNPKLKDFLLSTKDKILVEASPKDSIWGIGLNEEAPDATNPSKWKGQNLLGFALMEVRDRLRQIQKRLDAIIALKEDDDLWPPKDFIEFCNGHKFTQMIEWTHTSKGLFEGIKEAILGSDAVYSDKIFIDMQYGPNFGMMVFMFFEQLHAILDPVAKEYNFEFIFSLSPNVNMANKGREVILTLFA